MKPLAKSFSKKGFDFREVCRNGDVAIYERKAPHHRDAHYEVIVVQKERAYSRFGKDYPASERYPSSEEWGTYGWTYGGIDAADVRFKALTAIAASGDEIPATLIP